MGASFTESSDKQMAGEALDRADVAQQLQEVWVLKHDPLLQKNGNTVDLLVLEPRAVLVQQKLR